MYHINAGNLPGNDIARTFEGGTHGPASVSFFLVHNQPGQGPQLHQHPYDETFIILEGRVLVRVGDETVEGGPGDIVIGPPDTPHGFTNLGPEMRPAGVHPRRTGHANTMAALPIQCMLRVS